MDDLLGHPVQQMAVVADQEQGARITQQIVLEPEAGLEVEMVGRLVEQQQVGLGEQHGGERDPHPPAAGEAGQRARLSRLVEAEAGQDGARPRRGGVGADIGEPGLDRGDLGRIVDALGRLQQARPLEIGVEHGLAGRPLAPGRLLRDRSDGRPTPKAHLACVRADLAPDQAEQRGLAAAVAADQADPVPGRQPDARMLEQQAAADPEGHVVQMQHGGRDIARPGARPNPRQALSGPITRPTPEQSPSCLSTCAVEAVGLGHGSQAVFGGRRVNLRTEAMPVEKEPCPANRLARTDYAASGTRGVGVRRRGRRGTRR